MSKPKKKLDDCFALPKGVKWSPVDTALEKLKNGLSIIPKENLQPVEKSVGFIISKPCYAQISNPNFSNSAVDGYGLNGKNLSEDNTFNLLPKVSENSWALSLVGSTIFGTILFVGGFLSASLFLDLKVLVLKDAARRNDIIILHLYFIL